MITGWSEASFLQAILELSILFSAALPGAALARKFTRWWDMMSNCNEQPATNNRNLNHIPVLDVHIFCPPERKVEQTQGKKNAVETVSVRSSSSNSLSNKVPTAVIFLKSVAITKLIGNRQLINFTLSFTNNNQHKVSVSNPSRHHVTETPNISTDTEVEHTRLVCLIAVGLFLISDAIDSTLMTSCGAQR